MSKQILGKKKVFAKLSKKYIQKSIRERIEAFFLDNIGNVITREQIIKVSINPKTGKQPENWHQRLSELRTDYGYTILSHRDTRELSLEEYLMPHPRKRKAAGKRVMPTKKIWQKVLKHSNDTCEWTEGSNICGLKNGDIDPVGGGTVRLTPDHKSPHSVNPNSDPNDENAWQALCSRHQVVKKNFWDNTTGKLNYYALIQAAGKKDMIIVFDFLLDYYGLDKEEIKKLIKK